MEVSRLEWRMEGVQTYPRWATQVLEGDIWDMHCGSKTKKSEGGIFLHRDN